jgi:hypothetical protein
MKTTETDARAVIEKITRNTIVHDDSFVQRFGEGNVPGDCVAQGDLYLTKLEGVPHSAKPAEVRLQIAEGDTQGSRHILDSADGVRMYRISHPGPMDGPVLELTEERVLTHPEHRHVRLSPGVYGVHYQRNLDAEERVTRVRD